MPYMSSEHAAKIRKQIKKEFPDFKFSIVNRHLSQISITILSGPIQMLVSKDRTHEQVNQFYIKENYENFPEVRDVLQRIYEIANEGNLTISEDGDYGSIPAFYVSMSVGDWEKPYTVIN